MKTLKKPKIWLIILALLHTGPGVLIPYISMGGGAEYLSTILLFLCFTIYILYAAFNLKGQNQARLSVVICLPVLVFFIIGAFLKLEIMEVPVAPFPETILPIVVWTLPILTGVLNWNSIT
tara:strand:+ start:157 stop:519 length:363 start_codon:yes stop_codon:yes gene_type:complete